jgi:hypothetical protein
MALKLERSTPQPVAQTAVPQRAAPQMEKSTPQATPTPALPVRATPVKIPTAVGAKPAPVLPTYAEMVEQLEPLIQKQLEEVKQVLLQKKIEPKDFKAIYSVDITGREVQVCLACGQIGHNFRPTMVRQQNPEINMLSESLVVFLEVASRLGTSYGVIVYDEDVLPLREVLPPANNQADNATVLSRFDAFRLRKSNPDLGDRAWMAQELQRWQPSDATRKVSGEPSDRHALETAQAMLQKAGPAPARGVTVTKSQVPKASMKGLEAIAKGKGVKVSGIAVGKDAQAVSHAMFAKTAIAPTMHDVRARIGEGMKALVEQA